MGYEDLVTVIEPDRVIMYGDWVTGVIYDVLYGEDADLEADFLEKFELLGTDFLANPDEHFYQGADFMRVIRRKSDDRLFGYSYWNPIGKHSGDVIAEENGDQFGLQPEYTDEEHYCPVWVWLPVEPFTITGYRTAVVS